MMRTIVIMLLMTLGVYAQDTTAKVDKAFVGSVVEAVDKPLPKTIGLTEIQRLKDEVYQLKLSKLQDQINQINSERVPLLQGALKIAGVEGPDIEKYQYDQNNFIFVLQPVKDTSPSRVQKGPSPPPVKK